MEIGELLGFESRAEVKIAAGAVVDAVWEAKIGNMGKAIYVFEVQSKGSIDSLLLNLSRRRQTQLCRLLSQSPTKRSFRKSGQKARMFSIRNFYAPGSPGMSSPYTTRLCAHMNPSINWPWCRKVSKQDKTPGILNRSGDAGTAHPDAVMIRHQDVRFYLKKAQICRKHFVSS